GSHAPPGRGAVATGARADLRPAREGDEADVAGDDVESLDGCFSSLRNGPRRLQRGDRLRQRLRGEGNYRLAHRLVELRDSSPIIADSRRGAKGASELERGLEALRAFLCHRAPQKRVDALGQIRTYLRHR